MRSTMEVRHSSFCFFAATALSSIAVTSTLLEAVGDRASACTEDAGDDAGRDCGEVPSAAGFACAAGAALPNIAFMMLPRTPMYLPPSATRQYPSEETSLKFRYRAK